MATNLRRAGLRALNIDGTRFDVVGNIGYQLGERVLEELIGADGPHGFKETPGTPLMEFEVRDSGSLDVKALTTSENVTVTAELSNGKTLVLRNGYQALQSEQGTEEGIIPVRFVGASCEEILASN
jgi:hypothetical protein